jgi:lipopolysaccharide export system permease protein
LSLTIDDFYYNEYTIERLDKGQLDQLIETQIARGDSSVMNAQMEKHRRYSMPLSAIILTIIGVSLCSKKRRGGMGWNIAVGLALGFSYVLFEQFSKMFVVTDTLPAGIATWIPNILYAVIAAFLYIIAPK